MSQPPETPLVIPLDAEVATLELIGDKAAVLGRLTRAGLPVPKGFCLTTKAYRRFIASAGLQPAIDDALRGITRAGPATMERAAATIRAIFEAGTFPPDLVLAIRRGYARLGKPGRAVAVRASALAEDLPRAAGTAPRTPLLDLRGEAALLSAIRRCWTSFWTAEAIAYRERLEIDQREVALAVVVQKFVLADAAGIICTTNPVTREHGELLLTAGFGPGAAVGSGPSLPDLYFVTRDALAKPADELVATEWAQGAEATASTVSAAPRARRVLSDAWLHKIAQLGIEVENNCAGIPQELVWAREAGRCWILRTRPLAGPTPPESGEPPDEPPEIEQAPGIHQAPAVHPPPHPPALSASRPAPAELAWGPPDAEAAWVRMRLLATLPEPIPPLFADLYPAALEQELLQLRTAIGLPRPAGSIARQKNCATINGYLYLRAPAPPRWTRAPALLRAAVAAGAWTARGKTVDHWREHALPEYQTTIGCWQLLDLAAAPRETLQRGLRALVRADAAHWWATALTGAVFRIHEELLHRLLAGATVASGREARAELDELDDLAPDDDEWLTRAAPELGPMRRHLLRRLLHRAEEAAAAHSDANSHLGDAWPTLRELALELGRRLTAAGALAQPDDIFYLHAAELIQPPPTLTPLASLARERRLLHETTHHLHPPDLIPRPSQLEVPIE